MGQVTRQLEMEKAQLLEKKRREQEDRRRKQEELDQILLENRRKVMLPQQQLPCRAHHFWQRPPLLTMHRVLVSFLDSGHSPLKVYCIVHTALTV